MSVKHHPRCTPHYPEKKKGEPAQFVSREVLEDGYWVDTCHDCGAFETNHPPEDDPYWDEAKEDLGVK